MTDRAGFDQNNRNTLIALDNDGSRAIVELYADPLTHRLLVDSTGGSTPSLPTTVINGHQTATGTATALATGALTQGVIFEGLSTNTVSIFVGGPSVTTSTGIELQPGAALSAAVADVSDLYIVCASSSPVITWLGS